MLERRVFGDAGSPAQPQADADIRMAEATQAASPPAGSPSDATFPLASTADTSRRLSAHLATISSLFDRPIPRRFSRTQHPAEDAARNAVLASLAHHSSAMVTVAAARV